MKWFSPFIIILIKPSFLHQRLQKIESFAFLSFWISTFLTSCFLSPPIFIPHLIYLSWQVSNSQKNVKDWKNSPVSFYLCLVEHAHLPLPPPPCSPPLFMHSCCVSLPAQLLSPLGLASALAAVLPDLAGLMQEPIAIVTSGGPQSCNAYRIIHSSAEWIALHSSCPPFPDVPWALWGWYQCPISSRFALRQLKTSTWDCTTSASFPSGVEAFLLQREPSFPFHAPKSFNTNGCHYLKYLGIC